MINSQQSLVAISDIILMSIIHYVFISLEQITKFSELSRFVGTFLITYSVDIIF